jgi:DNA polymerase V
MTYNRAEEGGAFVSGNENHIYIAIDLKSFYASVECRERDLDPLTTNLVVADAERTEKTICLAVSPSLKVYGIPGRARLFEVVQRVKEVNQERSQKLPKRMFEGSSCFSDELKEHPELSVTYVTAKPRMALYMKYSTQIYDIYLRYIAPEDMHVYSIDEVFMDVTHYLNTYHMTAKELASKMILDVMQETGITATAGIGTNLYLCKVAMDIVAKHVEADKDGVRIAELDEQSYRELLWTHEPLTDFWRVGRGTVERLSNMGICTMKEIAHARESLLYKAFGIDAELLIDHAWGWEPCTIEDVKSYKPETNSLGSGQVLQCPYTWEKARVVVGEMIELLVLDLVEKELVTNQIVLTVGYDIECIKNPEIRKKYDGSVTTDYYGRKIPKHAHGTTNLKEHCSSTKLITEAVLKLYDEIVNKNLLIRRINIAANHVINEKDVVKKDDYEQLDLFTDYEEQAKKKETEEKQLQREKQMQKAMLEIKKKYGKNAILKGMNLEEGATTVERNRQIGGHKA